MTTLTGPVAPAAPRTRADTRRFRRYAAAALLPVPATLIATGNLWVPGYGADSTALTLDAVAADPGAYRLSRWIGLVLVLTLVPAFLAASRLARLQRPRLALAAAAVNTIAYLAVATGLGSAEALADVAVSTDADRAVVVPYLDALFSDPVVGVSTGLFVLGHVVGAVLLGLALWQSIPRWAALAMAVSQPLHLVAFVVLQNRYADAAAWGLTALALTVCAVHVLRTPDEAWDAA